MPSVLSWMTEDVFVVGETTFKILPDLGFWGRERLELERADFLVAKPRSLVERYVELISDLRPQYIFELGIFQGGSTALLAEIARPRRLVAIDRLPGRKHLVEEYASSRGLEDVVRTYGGVDQADRHRLAEIVDEEFDGHALDLVVDDCSHQYAETRESFNELFPRLRPGGLFVIEDWPWAHTPLDVEPLEGLFPDQVPLTRLIFEVVLAVPAVPGLIADITIDLSAFIVRRGDTTIDPHGFDIAACSNPRGQRLLAEVSPRDAG
jgi:SAM-dependent methyltransferase